MSNERNENKIGCFKKVTNEKQVSFYVTNSQSDVMKKHRTEQKLKTSKQMKLIVAYIFSNQYRLERFNEFIKENKDLIWKIKEKPLWN